MNTKQLERMHSGEGFIAALDQSGGSTPKALKAYGIEETAFHNEEEMFDLVHQMRSRIITSKAFTAKHILGAILFERTMESQIDGLYTADYLWDKKGIVPFLKVDKGLDKEVDGVQLMKPMPELDDLLKRANTHHIFGTKMRSVIHEANPVGIKNIVEQQFAFGKRIAKAGLVPIIEPEVSIDSPTKKEAEEILLQEIKQQLASLDCDIKLMFKLTIPTNANLYAPLMKDPHVVRVVALSGGYTRKEADALLTLNNGLIASFSRALASDLCAKQTQDEFDACLQQSIAEIYSASRT